MIILPSLHVTLFCCFIGSSLATSFTRNGATYTLVGATNNNQYSQALGKCNANELLWIEDAAEAMCLKEGGKFPITAYWIAGSAAASRTHWQNGKPFPSFVPQPPSNDQCLSIELWTSPNPNFAWKPCDYGFHVICKSGGSGNATTDSPNTLCPPAETTTTQLPTTAPGEAAARPKAGCASYALVSREARLRSSVAVLRSVPDASVATCASACHATASCAGFELRSDGNCRLAEKVEWEAAPADAVRSSVYKGAP